MNMPEVMKLVKVISAITLLSLSLSGHGHEGFYIGLASGQVNYGTSLNDFVLLDDGSLTGESVADGDTSVSLTVGYQFTDSFGLEGGFIDLGGLTFEAISNGSGSIHAIGNVRLSSELEGLLFNVKGTIPVSERFSLYGKFGLLRWNNEFTSTFSTNTEDSGSDLLAGAGIALALTHGFSFNMDYLLIDLDGNSVDVTSLGLQYHF